MIRAGNFADGRFRIDDLSIYMYRFDPAMTVPAFHFCVVNHEHKVLRRGHPAIQYRYRSGKGDWGKKKEKAACSGLV